MAQEKVEAPGTLLEAILAVQGEVGTLPKNAVNPHFNSKYVPLDTIVEVVGPILNKHGLVWMAFPITHDGHSALRYMLYHAASDVKVEGVMALLNPKGDMQGLGSALTYARRYALCAVLNLVADVDDDGNAAKAPSPTDLARARSRMTDKGKALLAEADKLAEGHPAEVYAKWRDSTGYEEAGLQRLVKYLQEHPADA